MNDLISSSPLSAPDVVAFVMVRMPEAPKIITIGPGVGKRAAPADFHVEVQIRPENEADVIRILLAINHMTAAALDKLESKTPSA